jgi:hypothetical protein
MLILVATRQTTNNVEKTPIIKPTLEYIPCLLVIIPITALGIIVLLGSQFSNSQMVSVAFQAS